MNESVTKKDLLDVKDEILGAVSKGFTAVEERIQTMEERLDKKIDGVEERLGMKIDGVRSSLDAEILRRVDDYSAINKRLSALEALHGIGV